MFSSVQSTVHRPGVGGRASRQAWCRGPAAMPSTQDPQTHRPPALCVFVFRRRLSICAMWSRKSGSMHHRCQDCPVVVVVVSLGRSVWSPSRWGSRRNGAGDNKHMQPSQNWVYGGTTRSQWGVILSAHMSALGNVGTCVAHGTSCVVTGGRASGASRLHQKICYVDMSPMSTFPIHPLKSLNGKFYQS